jgi:hypothetical protein
MCCFLTSLALVGPRLALLVYLLLPFGYAKANLAFHTFIWPFLGWVFLPWTTLMYLLAYPLYGFGWFLLGLGLCADIASYASAAYKREEFPYYIGP